MKSTAVPTILIVDDTPANLHSAKKLLTHLDVHIVTADSGNTALTLLLEYEVMLILLDVNMPLMDGYETAELILQIEEYKHIPIIFITAQNKGEKQEYKGYEVGAVDYLFKPVNPEILIGKVKVFLKLYHQKILLIEQKIELDRLLQNKNILLQELETQNCYKDSLVLHIQKQTRKIKITFRLCSFAFIIIICSISWMYLIILEKNSQLLNYTELLNEKNILFSDLKQAITENKDERVQELLGILENKDIKLLTTRWEDSPAFWEWKKDEKLTSQDNESRYKIVATVAQLANIIAARDKFFIPTAPLESSHDTYGWTVFGTKDKRSDVDYGIATITNKEHLFSHNAIQGRKAVIASIIFRALFGATSLKLLDTEFYPPSMGAFLHDALSSRTSLYAIFSQLANLINAKELKSFEKELEKECKAHNISYYGTIINILQDAAQLHNDVEAIKKIVPNPELANNIICNKISLSMAECGDNIDQLPRDDPNRKILIDTFAFLNILRTHFLPEGFISRGAFKVICENVGGQKHQVAHRRIEEAALAQNITAEALATATMEASAETAARATNSPQEYLESVGENSAFFHHRSDLVDASKYGSRVYESALLLIKILEQRAGDAKQLKEMKKIHEFIKARAEEMSVLESAKRGKLFERMFYKLFKKIFYKELSQTANITTSQQATLLSQAVAAAHCFYKQACYGSEEFVVLTAQTRIENFMAALNKDSLSDEMTALVENVSRLTNPLHKKLLEKIIEQEAKNEITEMKKNRGLLNGSDSELFNTVATEVRQTLAKLLTLSFSTGLMEPPHPSDTKIFAEVKADVKQTITRVLTNTRNIGIGTASQLTEEPIMDNSFLWE